jgi:cold shock CspA family protein
LGFITPDDGAADTFFHVTAWKDGEEIVPGVAVKFEIGTDPKSGRTRATVVDLA